ncbi:MAG TPA: lysylphosphatidylglycerol synthase domain-containing protein [Steroidobacteraceae bacterium]|nr:lysylphosphatidylglycerol synthase domain-containing protein [Steroidobacteraceae bacterium]
MKWAMRLALALGTALCVALIVREGLGPILALLAAAGWRLLWLVPLHALPLLLDALGWRQLLRAAQVAAPASAAPRLWVVAAVREAVNRLLPVANIGGEIVGIRLVCRLGGDPAPVAASVVVEVLLTIISQLLFAAAGVLILLRLTGAAAIASQLLLALAFGVALVAALYLLIHRGSVFERILRGVEGMLDLPSQLRGMLGQAAALDARLRELLGQRAALLATLLWQLAGFVAGALETWLALRWLQHPVGFATALALESLTQAIRHFIFVVPAGLGVQEAGLVGFGYLLGLGNDAGIALSLAKRMREVLFGVPALVYWQLA